MQVKQAQETIKGTPNLDELYSLRYLSGNFHQIKCDIFGTVGSSGEC
jgi:hypothetical protein